MKKIIVAFIFLLSISFISAYYGYSGGNQVTIQNINLSGNVSHNSLDGLQGGSPGQYLHINQSVYNSFINMLSTYITVNVNNLINYYTKTEVDSIKTTSELDLRTDINSNFSYLNNLKLDASDQRYNDTSLIETLNASIISINGDLGNKITVVNNTLYFINSSLTGNIISVNNTLYLINSTISGQILSINDSILLINNTLDGKITSVNNTYLIADVNINDRLDILNKTKAIQELLNSTGIYSIYNKTYNNYALNVSRNWTLDTFTNWNLDWSSTYNKTYHDYAINVSTNWTALTHTTHNSTWDNNWLTAMLSANDTLINSSIFTYINDNNLSNYNNAVWNVSGTNVFPNAIGGNVGIGTTNPSYPLTIYRNTSQENSSVSVWAIGNYSGTGYIIRSATWDKSKDVWDYIKDSDYYLDNGILNHSKFFGAVSYKGLDYKNPIITINTQEVCEDEIDEISGNTSQICSTQDVSSTTYNEIKEEGIELGAEVAVLRQAVFELKKELCTIKPESELCKI